MKNIRLMLALATILAAVSVSAAPMVPIATVWTATPCDNWNCAASALVLANGDPNVLVIPTAGLDHRWVILKRVTGDAIIPPPDTTFSVEVFDGVTDGSARFGAIAPNQTPFLVTVPDGKTLLVYLAQAPAKPRAASR